MPRRGTELGQVPEPLKKKLKVVLEEIPSLDGNFCDDEALPSGIIFTDVQQKKWRLGKPIGRGSFGRIYLASDEVEQDVTKANARYVVKIEPHSNGPLFVEIHCLIKVAQVAKVREHRLENKQKCLGMPIYIASGSFVEESTGTKYRFLVLPRYDIDLQKIISRTRVLDIKHVLVLAVQILDVLEYLHKGGYTHSDIKSSNLMLGFDGSKIGRNQQMMKPSLSFEKETKEVAVLAGKHRRVKSGRPKISNYYDDEDFIVRDYKSPTDPRNENEKKLSSVKNKLRKILSDKESRTLHRHHAFNLRQLSSYVNYEDMNSSVCSDQSYQKLLDDFGNKTIILTSEEFTEDVKRRNAKVKFETDQELDDIYKEAVISQSNGQIYLLDYGLASKFVDSEGKHKEYSMDARKAHDGTLEYSSRDSHNGAHSRRSDLETLGYNLLDWLTGTLPWKTTEVLAEPDLVHAIKKNYMSDVKSLLKTCFKTEFYPQFIEKYFEHFTSLDFTEKPDYNYCRNLFKNELMKSGSVHDKDLMLNFAESPMSPVSRNKFLSKRFGRKNTPVDFLSRSGIRKSYERENYFSLENDLKLELFKQTLNLSSEGVRKPCASRNFFISDADLVARLKKSLMPHDVFGKKLSPKNLRSKKKTIQRRKGRRTHRNNIGKFGNFMGSARQFTWAEILAGNPEDIIRKERNAAQSTDDDDENECKYRIRKISDTTSENNLDCNLQSPLAQKDFLEGLNPTHAMKKVHATFRKKLTNKNTKTETEFANSENYTPEMVRILKLKLKREEKEKLEALTKEKDDKVESAVKTRCTRSMRNKNVKKIQPSSIVTRKKTASVEEKTSENVELGKDRKSDRSKSKSTSTIDSKKLAKPDLDIVKQNATEDVGINKVIKNDRSKSKRNKNVGSDKETVTELEIVDEQKAVKAKSPRARTFVVPTNRRRLRSSKRK